MICVMPAEEPDLEAVVERLVALRAPLVRMVLARHEERRRGPGLADRLSIPQEVTLVALAGGPMTMRELADRTGVAPSTTTRMVQGLERQGLVTRAAQTAPDRRRRRVALTEQGQVAIAEARESQRTAMRRLITGLPPRQRRTILDGVQALTDALAADGAPGTASRAAGHGPDRAG